MYFSVDLIFSLTFLFIFHLLPLFSTQEFHPSSYTCPKDFQCGKLGNLNFPFTDIWQPYCGLCVVKCYADPLPSIKIDVLSEQWFSVQNMSENNFKLHDPILQNLLKDKSCYSFLYNIHLPRSPSISFVMASNITLFRCSKRLKQADVNYFRDYRRNESCERFDVYYKNPKSQSSNWDWKPHPTDCEPLMLPIRSYDNITDNTELFQFLSAEFDVEWHLSDECYDCHLKGGFCDQADGGKFRCTYAETRTGNKKLRIITGAAIGGVVVSMIAFAIFLVLRCKKGINNPFYKLSSKPEIAGRSVSFGVPIFSCAELEEATNNFDASKELGNGGFGIVYYGKLRDGREVAVKRLYEHNYKRMAQFMNEVEILTGLRHRNLVSLYGCTSRQSRELLLVYEYIPNGTLANHLHGYKGSIAYMANSNEHCHRNC